METIMDARQDGITLVTHTTGMASRAQGGKHRRNLVLAIVSSAILISALQILPAPGDKSVAGVVIHIPQSAQADAQVKYFPAQYVNQAQNAQAEEHIQAF
jgi:hypothetical protein